MIKHVVGMKSYPPPRDYTHMRGRRVFRTIYIAQLLMILTCSGLAITMWLMIRLEAFQKSNGVLVNDSERRLPESLVKNEQISQNSIVRGKRAEISRSDNFLDGRRSEPPPKPKKRAMPAPVVVYVASDTDDAL